MKKINRERFNNINFFGKVTFTKSFVRHCSMFNSNNKKKTITNVNSPSLTTFKASLNSILSILARIFAGMAVFTGTVLVVGTYLHGLSSPVGHFYMIWIHTIEPCILFVFMVSVVGHLLTHVLHSFFIKKD